MAGARRLAQDRWDWPMAHRLGVNKVLEVLRRADFHLAAHGGVRAANWFRRGLWCAGLIGPVSLSG